MEGFLLGKALLSAYSMLLLRGMLTFRQHLAWHWPTDSCLVAHPEQDIAELQVWHVRWLQE